MNTPLNFELSKLLKGKGFDSKCSHYYIDDFQNFKHDGKLYKTGLPNDIENENILQFVKRTKQPHLCNAPTISQVVMWLYDKYDIWISVDSDADKTFYHTISFDHHISEGLNYNTPTEAYEAAIEYTLKNLI
jgi:hypothetical protein